VFIGRLYLVWKVRWRNGCGKGSAMKDKVVDLAARRAKKQSKRVRCLTIFQDDPSKPERAKHMRQATPEEMKARAHWQVGPFHRPTPPATSLAFRWAGRSTPVQSVEDAARKWHEFREATAEGVSQIGNGGEVVNERGEVIARISYNGRVTYS
jgi:hypothetical protein